MWVVLWIGDDKFVNDHHRVGKSIVEDVLLRSGLEHLVWSRTKPPVEVCGTDHRVIDV